MKPLNPYALPDGNVSISFSGGRTSAYMLWAIMEANGGLPDRVRVVFANTGRERPETLDFVAEVNRRWGVGVTWVEFRRGAPGYEVVDRQGASLDGQPFDPLTGCATCGQCGSKRYISADQMREIERLQAEYDALVEREHS